MVRRAVTVAAVLVSAFGAVVGAAWLFQRSLIYFPIGAVPPVEAALSGAEEVTFRTGDGLDLAGWYLPATGEELAAVVVFNGNAGNRADRAGLARSFAAAGMSTLLFDYRGYGGNPGRPTEPGLVRDGTAAAAYLAARTDAPVVYFGESLGAGVATGVAVERPPSALVLRSPFTSLVGVAKVHYRFLPASWLLKDRYPVEEHIAEVRAPVLVIASRDDEIVPYGLSERVFAAAAGEKSLVTFEAAGHNDAALTSGPRLVAEVVEFVRRSTGG